MSNSKVRKDLRMVIYRQVAEIPEVPLQPRENAASVSRLRFTNTPPQGLQESGSLPFTSIRGNVSMLAQRP
jgi:hypothetical protein